MKKYNLTNALILLIFSTTGYAGSFNKLKDIKINVENKTGATLEFSVQTNQTQHPKFEKISPNNFFRVSVPSTDTIEAILVRQPSEIIEAHKEWERQKNYETLGYQITIKKPVEKIDISLDKDFNVKIPLFSTNNISSSNIGKLKVYKKADSIIINRSK